MKISYLGKRDGMERAAIIESFKELENKKLELIVDKLNKIGYNPSGFDGEEGNYYIIPVDDKEDYDELKKEYLALKNII